MIKAHIMDADVLAARTPAEVSAYLRGTGWSVVHRTESAAVWELSANGGELEILQPLDPGLRDYALRIADAMVTLAAAEGRSELEVLRAISASTWDVHTISLFPPDAPAGMIAIDDGVSAHESLRGLVSAAAYPVFAGQQRAVQPSRKPQGLIDFMRTVRFGPAFEGSYVLTLHTPVPPRLSEQPPLFEDLGLGLPDEEPVERRVSLGIYGAVRAAHEAADAALLSADGLAPFTGAVRRGVSANLCEALAGFGGDGGHAFELAVSLAATRPNPAPLPPVRFRPHHVPVLREAAAELRARTAEEDVAVVGDVVRLHREGGGAGEITLVGRVEDSETLRRIWMDLSEQDYPAAVRAHEQTRQVTVRGNLVRRGTRYYLAGAGGFRILSDTEVE
jgi:hypothetical protein